MSRRVILAGDSLKDSIWWAGSLDRIDVGYNIDPIRARRTHMNDIPLCRESHLAENFIVLGGDLPAPDPS